MADEIEAVDAGADAEKVAKVQADAKAEAKAESDKLAKAKAAADKAATDRAAADSAAKDRANADKAAAVKAERALSEEQALATRGAEKVAAEARAEAMRPGHDAESGQFESKPLPDVTVPRTTLRAEQAGAVGQSERGVSVEDAVRQAAIKAATKAELLNELAACEAGEGDPERLHALAYQHAGRDVPKGD